MRRCWSLAEHLRGRGAVVRVVFPRAGPEVAFRSSGFRVDIATADGLLGWIALHRDFGPRLIIVDDPAFPSDGLARLAEVAPTVCIDDVCERTLPVDVVVNGSAGAERLNYRGLPTTQYLLGAGFILLRRAFAELPTRPSSGEAADRVLVTTGGGAFDSISQRIVSAVRSAIPSASIAVVIGPFSSALRLDQPHVTTHRDPGDLRSLMLAADLAVSGAGQTAYELAATGTPTIGVLLAENQRINLAGLVAAGCLLGAGSPTEPEFDQRLETTVRELSHAPVRRAEMSRSGRCLVDGRGAERVAALAVELATSTSLRKNRTPT